MTTPEQRIQVIIEKNVSPMPKYGMAGGLMVFQEVLNPNRSNLKSKAASYLLVHRECVKANRNFFQREYRGTTWLDKAAFCRAEAMKTI